MMRSDYNGIGAAARRPIRRVLLVAGMVIGVGGALLAQSTRLPVDRPAPDDLLAEVRSLRHEMAQAAAAGIRAQLLLTRLQLEEQRVLTLSQQLVDAQRALGGVQTTLTGERSRVQLLEDQASRGTEERRQSILRAISEAGSHLEDLGGRELEWRTREEELSRAVADARTRWADFNAQLDALEQSLPAPDVR